MRHSYCLRKKILFLSESQEDEQERLGTLQGALMKEVVLTPAITPAGVAAKLNLWRQTQTTYLDENDVLWDSLADDLFRLSGVAVEPFHSEPSAIQAPSKKHFPHTRVEPPNSAAAAVTPPPDPDRDAKPLTEGKKLRSLMSSKTQRN